eukprot:10190593-Prorocentrum_lima.AAC.1
MTSSLVGSEMCIRDRALVSMFDGAGIARVGLDDILRHLGQPSTLQLSCCLLYTSDAADDM